MTEDAGMPLDLTLYLATDRRLLGNRDLGAVISAAVGAGVTAVQFREKEQNKGDTQTVPLDG